MYIRCEDLRRTTGVGLRILLTGSSPHCEDSNDDISLHDSNRFVSSGDHAGPAPQPSAHNIKLDAQGRIEGLF